MEYRFNADELMRALGVWDSVLPGRGKIHLIACGGMALTRLGYKESTKDVDREDCLALAKQEPIDPKELEMRFRETAKYDVGEEKALRNLKLILDDLKTLRRRDR